MTTSKIKQGLDSFIDAHPAFSVAIIACCVFAVLLVVFWFVVFSGLSSTADFVYNHF